MINNKQILALVSFARHRRCRSQSFPPKRNLQFLHLCRDSLALCGFRPSPPCGRGKNVETRKGLPFRRGSQPKRDRHPNSAIVIPPLLYWPGNANVARGCFWGKIKLKLRIPEDTSALGRGGLNNDITIAGICKIFPTSHRADFA
jgi:hypothetical protein